MLVAASDGADIHVDHGQGPSAVRPARSCGAAIVDSFRKLDPRAQVRNPVMFVV